MKTLDEIHDLRLAEMSNVAALSDQSVSYIYWVGYTAGTDPSLFTKNINVTNLDEERMRAFKMGIEDAKGDANEDLG